MVSLIAVAGSFYIARKCFNFLLHSMDFFHLLHSCMQYHFSWLDLYRAAVFLTFSHFQNFSHVEFHYFSHVKFHKTLFHLFHLLHNCWIGEWVINILGWSDVSTCIISLWLLTGGNIITTVLKMFSPCLRVIHWVSWLELNRD